MVSVVLLSYNRPAKLREALSALYDQSFKNLKIIVVDNPSSTSEEIAAIVTRHTEAKLIRNQQNLGYAGGMNTGIAHTSGEYVLTEDDIMLESDCIERLVEHMEANRSADLITPIIYNKAEKTIRCAGGDVVLGGVYRKKMFGAGELDTGQFSAPFDVNFIDGAAMFARKTFWQRFKGFRAEYFMYAEAVELCERVRKSGGKMTVVPKAKVYHCEPDDETTSPEIEFHRTKNFFSLYLLHAPARCLPEFVCRYAVINTVRTLMGRTANRPRTFLKALFWVAKRTPSLVKERYNRNGGVN
jgi:GT2 family glycosyltransferase